MAITKIEVWRFPFVLRMMAAPSLGLGLLITPPHDWPVVRVPRAAPHYFSFILLFSDVNNLEYSFVNKQVLL
jgi:hypothetical protein